MNVLETVRAEDFVEYFIFLDHEELASNGRLQEIYDLLLAFVTPITENYIWHRDEFTITKVTATESETKPSHLHGVLHYGDNIEDEWFVVYLLLSFTKQCSDIFVKLIDSDGEFLLIEAANSLPEWLQSENSNYRSYIYNGLIKIIPGKFSTEMDSISKVSKHLKSSVGASDVERKVTRCIERRIDRFASCLDEFLHRSKVYIPGKVAALLMAKPGLIASAVTAYCQRDIIDAKICKNMRHFLPKDMVLRLVTFTKFLYAMVSHDKILSEKNRSTWVLPPSSHPDYKEFSLGFKIACGFEILASKCKNIAESDLSLNKKWLQYLVVLKRKGYFKDFLEGSNDYVNLEKQARNYFLENTGTIKSDSDCVLNILQTVDYDYDAMKREESQLPPSDEEKWMEVDDDNFSKLLKERFGCADISTNSPEVLSSTLNAFFNRLSDIEGVETNDKDLVDSSHMDVDTDNQIHPITFDSDNFLPSLEKMLNTMGMKNENGIFDETSSADSNNDSESETDDEEENTSEDADLKSYMQLMDQELENTIISENAIKSDKEESGEGADVEKIILKNFLKSCEEQYGGSGPAGNLLHSMGMRLKIQKKE